MTTTNIKNLPEGPTYFTEIGYTQRYPWVEIKRTAKTVTLARVMVQTDPEWLAKKDFRPGGFVGHVANQDEQTWLFGWVDVVYTVTVRLNNKGEWRNKGTKFVEGVAREFYDYNF